MTKRTPSPNLSPETLEAVYRFIGNYSAQYGYGPSLREIAQACYMSRPNVYRYLDRLEVEGLIVREPHRARAIAVVKKKKKQQ